MVVIIRSARLRNGAVSGNDNDLVKNVLKFVEKHSGSISLRLAQVIIGAEKDLGRPKGE
jgi:hypothetical protein